MFLNEVKWCVVRCRLVADENYKTNSTFARGQNIEKSYQYLCPFGDNPPKVTQTVLTPVYNSEWESISKHSGKSPKGYAGTGCVHSHTKQSNISVDGSRNRVINCMNPLPPWNYVKGSLLETCTGSVNTPLPGPHNFKTSNFQNEVIKTMKRMMQTGGVGKPPRSIGLGETLGEMSLSAKSLTESLLKMSPPIPRPTDKWNLWTPDEIADFRKWKDTFHPLELLFGLYPVAGQTAELAFEAKDKMDNYAQKCGKWIKRLKRTSSSFRAEVTTSDIKDSFNVSPTSNYVSLDEKLRISYAKVYLTGRMSCTDVSQFQMPYDIMEYVNESWLITGWDLTSYSYLFDRFSGGAVKKILKAAINAERSMSTGSGANNETIISLYNVQLHDLRKTTSQWQVSSLGKAGASGESYRSSYTRSWPDEIGAISESYNGAQAIADLFDNPITPLNGWSPTQYLDVLFLFIPPIVLKST